jgi:hypothetical protein
MKKQVLRPGILLGASLVFGVLATGCIASIGGGGKERVTSAQPTRGQELLDLQKAQNSGAITPEEYDAQKKRILEK